MMMKLGKKPARHDARTLKLAHYLTPSPPPAPASLDNTFGITAFGMMLNDTLGDCTCAGYGHAEQTWTKSGGTEWTATDDQVLALYEGACGYVNGDPSTDNGGDELTVLNYIRQNGLGDRKTLDAYADPEPSNIEQIKQAMYLFGGVYIGIQLPISAQSQVGSLWQLSTDPVANVAGSWGGHAVWCLAYTPSTITCVTWGGLQLMSWDFWSAYTDESHALLSSDWTPPGGFNMAQLQTDLAIITAN
jgi:hypothetical protein